MLSSIRASIGFLVSRLRFRRVRDTIVLFNDALTRAQRVLLVMPFDRREFLPTVMVIELLKRKVRESQITVVTGNHAVEAMRILPHSQFIKLLPGETSMFFLPKGDAMDRIRRNSYDIAIDLNLDLVLPSGYICKASGAKIRVGFARRRSDPFYNFQIRPDLTLGRKLIYDRMVKCLDMF